MRIIEPRQSENAKKITEKRYLMTDNNGEYVETVGEMLWRVAQHMAKPEILWGGKKTKFRTYKIGVRNLRVSDVAELFYERMVKKKFVCSGKAMYEAGNHVSTGQLAACFVLPVKDNIDSIFKTLGEAAIIHKNNGGTGFNFSMIRPHGDKVKNVLGAASGPVDFLKAYSAALSKILQGTKRQGANMGILNIDHPDIEEFIKVKLEDGNLKNFNVSVGVTNQFMKAVKDKKYWYLINPRTKKRVKKLRADKLFDLIVEKAYESGDPGIAFLDRINKDNPTPELGKIDATNPCGEIPLLPYESCNLTSIVLSNHVKNGEIDWKDLEKSIMLGIRFLDNMVEVNNYPLDKIEKIVKDGNRRIGLGVMGFGHLLYKLKISYNGEKAIKLSEKLASFIREMADKETEKLGKERGNFGNYDISIFADSGKPRRNCATTMIAPTGTTSLFADCSSGIEPVFSLITLRKAFFEDNKNNEPTKELKIVDSVFEKYLEKNFELKIRKKILEKVASDGTVENVREIPLKMRRVFVTAHDIDWQYHVRVQASWQKYFDNSVSKTINFSNSATKKDVKDAYLLAWELGCKGITVYRDGSKKNQVLQGFGSVKDKNSLIEVCPECDYELEVKDGCEICNNCGWSKCNL